MADLQNDIEKYLKGELSPAERNRLEKMALDDPFLADALEGAEEMGAKAFQENVQQIHTKLDQRIVKHKKAFGWFWPLRIAAGFVLLICSTFIIWYFIQDESYNELALNKTEETSTLKPESQPLRTDSVAIEEKSEDKDAAITQQEVPQQKAEAVKVEPVPVPEKITEQSKPKEVVTEPIAKAEVAAEEAFEIAADEEIAAVKPENKLAERKAAQPEAVSRSKKADVPAAGVPASQQGIIKTEATTQVIKGKVIDKEDGAPLPGVNVLVKGTIQGTMTDLEGNYQIEVDDPNQTLVFSFIGLETKEENIDGRTQLDIALDEDISELSEVVVTGYGYNDDDIFTNNLPDYVAAEPEGGFKAYKIYLDDNLHYPIQAIENKVQGKVTVRFEISATGTISDFQITKGIGFGCDEEAIRLIRQGPKWSSPKRGDQPVKGRVKVRVKFSLPK